MTADAAGQGGAPFLVLGIERDAKFSQHEPSLQMRHDKGRGHDLETEHACKRRLLDHLTFLSTEPALGESVTLILRLSTIPSTIPGFTWISCLSGAHCFSISATSASLLHASF